MANNVIHGGAIFTRGAAGQIWDVNLGCLHEQKYFTFNNGLGYMLYSFPLHNKAGQYKTHFTKFKTSSYYIVVTVALLES